MSRDSPIAGEATQSSAPLEVDRPPLSKDVFVSYASQDAAVVALGRTRCVLVAIHDARTDPSWPQCSARQYDDPTVTGRMATSAPRRSGPTVSECPSESVPRT